MTVMATLDSGFGWRGTLGEYTAYRLPGKEGIVIRRKGGVSAKRIKTAPEFEGTRRGNEEFKGRVAAAKWMRSAMVPLTRLGGQKIMGRLNKTAKAIQDLDTESPLGHRHVLLTRNPRLLDGFSVNKEISFDSMVSVTPDVFISREDLSASVIIPQLIPGINLHLKYKVPHYCFVVTLGIVPDLLSTDNGYHPQQESYEQQVPVMAISEWFSADQGSPSTEMNLKSPSSVPDEKFSLMVTIGIVLGHAGQNPFHAEKPAGAAKVVAVR
jgi:hypothetical protein